MAVRYFLHFLVLSIVTVSCFSLEQLDSTQKCQEQCNKSYAPHTSITNGEPESCQRGCRFYAIAKLLAEKKPEGSSTVEMCNQSCGEAYNGNTDALLMPCFEGCKFQDMSTLPQVVTGTEDKEDFMSRLQHATPIMQVRKVMAKVVGGFQILRTQVMTYFLQDDNTLLAVQSPAEIVIDAVPGMESEGQKTVQEFLESENKAADDAVNQRDDPFFLANSKDSVSKVSLESNRRYTYLMHLLILLAGVSMALLGLSYCLALARHQQKKTLKAANLNLALHQEPLKLVRPEDLTKLSLMDEEDMQAPPLPNKHDLNLTQANV